MSSEPEYPYVNHMNILHGPCELIDVSRLVRECTDPWYNQTLCRVNESVVRLGVLQGEYHWHQHEDDDEFFFVVSGRLEIELEGGGSVELTEQQGYVVPRGLLHRPIAETRTVVLMVETAGIVPTGTPVSQVTRNRSADDRRGADTSGRCSTKAAEPGGRCPV